MKDSSAAYSKRVKDLAEHVEGFAIAQRLLGPDRPVAFEDMIAYSKVHLPERTSWVICRFYFGRRGLFISVPLPTERIQQSATSFVVTVPEKWWAGIALNAVSDLEKLGAVLVAAYEQQRAMRLGGAPEPGPGVEETRPAGHPSLESLRAVRLLSEAQSQFRPLHTPGTVV